MATDRLKDSRSQKFLLPVHNYNIDTEMNENRVFLDTKLNCERNVSHIQIKMENSLWFSTQKISNFSIRIITTISCVCVCVHVLSFHFCLRKNHFLRYSRIGESQSILSCKWFNTSRMLLGNYQKTNNRNQPSLIFGIGFLRFLD